MVDLLIVLKALIMDPLIVWCSKRNNGVYEPEFRLIPVIFGLIGGAGLFAYAYVVDVKGNMYLASFLWGLTLFGIIFVLTPANSYVIDVSRVYTTFADERTRSFSRQHAY